MNYSFTLLKSYSAFLLHHHIDGLVRDMIQKAKEADLHALKLLSRFSEEELFEMSKNGVVHQILTPIIEDHPFQELLKGIEGWKQNALVIPKDQLLIHDITSIINIRKRSFTQFAKFYKCSEEEKYGLIDEIAIYFDTSIDYGLAAYEEIQKDELKGKERLITGIIDSIPAAITKIDKGGIILDSVGAGLKTMGLKEQELKGKNIFDLYPDADNARRALRGEFVSFIGKTKSQDGEVHEFQTFYIPQKDGAIGFSIDITKQLEIEEQVASLIENVTDYAIYRLNPDGTVATWNAGAKALKGYSKDEILGKHFSIFYPKEKQETKFPDKELEQAEKTGRFEDEGWRVRKDGTKFWANVVITSLYDKDKKLIGFSKITRDLSERKQLEESLKDLNLQLEEKVKKRTEELSKTILQLRQINNDLDNFIYTASHDLKAPVSNIEGLITGLFDEFNKEINNNSTIDAFKNMIEASIMRFKNTIMELTEIVKIQKSFEGDCETVNLYEVVEDVKISIQDLIQSNQAEIICDFNEISKIKFVKKNIQSIFYNFISNGIKYRDPDKKPIMKIQSNLNGSFILLSFKDNGLGIKEENKDKIFSMFKRFHTHVEGSGIGLYIVKRIVENAGGKIEIDSKEGQGSTFLVTLPNR